MSAPIVITRQLLANDAAIRWRRQYESGIYGLDKLEIADKLDALGPSPIPDSVDGVIGNGSWTRIPSCSGCGAKPITAVVQVGEDPDYESHTAYLCKGCVTKAADALRAELAKEPQA